MNEALKASLPSVLAVGLPSLMVLVGILLNQRAVEALRSDMRDLKTEMKGELGGLRAEVNTMRTTFHNDIIMLLQRDAEKDMRIVRLEERSPS